MQHNNWDSAKIHAVNVLAWANDEKDISLANTIITLANDNLVTDEKEHQEIRSGAFKHLEESFDSQDDISWFYDHSTPQFTVKNSFHLYIGNRGDDYWLRFRIQYAGRKKLSLLGYAVTTDTKSYTFSPTVDAENGRDRNHVWELFDQEYTGKTHEMVQDIIHSESAKLVMIGSNGNFEREISEEEKGALRHILEAYIFTPNFTSFHDLDSK